jgi:hypothetical protein
MVLTNKNFALESVLKKSPVKAKEVNNGPGFFLEIGNSVADYTNVETSELFKIVPISETQFIFKSVKFEKFLRLSKLKEIPYNNNKVFAATLESLYEVDPEFVFTAFDIGKNSFVFKNEISGLYLAVYDLGMDVGGLDSRNVLSLESSKIFPKDDSRYLFRIYNQTDKNYVSNQQLFSMFPNSSPPGTNPTPTPSPPGTNPTPTPPGTDPTPTTLILNTKNILLIIGIILLIFIIFILIFRK